MSSEKAAQLNSVAKNARQHLCEHLVQWEAGQHSVLERIEVGSWAWWKQWALQTDVQKLKHYLDWAREQGVDINALVPMVSKSDSQGIKRYTYALQWSISQGSPEAIKVLLDCPALEVKKSLIDWSTQMLGSKQISQQQLHGVVKALYEDEPDEAVWKRVGLVGGVDQAELLYSLLRSGIGQSAWAYYGVWSGWDVSDVQKLWAAYPKCINYMGLSDFGAMQTRVWEDRWSESVDAKVRPSVDMMCLQLEHIDTMLPWCAPVLGINKLQLLDRVRAQYSAMEYKNYRFAQVTVPQDVEPKKDAPESVPQSKGVLSGTKEAWSGPGTLVRPSVDNAFTASASDALLLGPWIMVSTLQNRYVQSGKQSAQWIQKVHAALLKSEQCLNAWQQSVSDEHAQCPLGVRVKALRHQIMAMTLPTMVLSGKASEVVRVLKQADDTVWHWQNGAPIVPVRWSKTLMDNLATGLVQGHFERINSNAQAQTGEQMLKTQNPNGTVVGVSVGSFCLLQGHLGVFKELMKIEPLKAQWILDPLRDAVLSVCMGIEVIKGVREHLDLTDFEDQKGQNPMHWALARGHVEAAERLEKLIPMWVCKVDGNGKMPHECGRVQKPTERMVQMQARALALQVPQAPARDSAPSTLRL